MNENSRDTTLEWLNLHDSTKSWIYKPTGREVCYYLSLVQGFVDAVEDIVCISLCHSMKRCDMMPSRTPLMETIRINRVCTLASRKQRDESLNKKARQRGELCGIYMLLNEDCSTNTAQKVELFLRKVKNLTRVEVTARVDIFSSSRSVQRWSFD